MTDRDATGCRTGAVLVLLALAGCASGSGGASEWGGEPSIAVQIENRSRADAAVYLTREGRRLRRLATVMSGREVTLRIPWTSVSGGGLGFQLGARLIGSDEFHLSPALTVYPGDVLGWTVHDRASRSTATLHRSGEP